MDDATFHSRVITLFLQGQRLPYRRILEQCKLSVQGEEIVIEGPDKLVTRAVWLRAAHIARPATKLGVMSIRFR